MSPPKHLVVVLAGGRGERFAHLLKMLGHTTIDHIIISGGTGTWPEAATLLEEPPAETTVELFWPNPATTQGEARHLGKILRGQQSSITVVTSDYHVRRARRWLTHHGLPDITVHGVPTAAFAKDRLREALATVKTMWLIATSTDSP